MIRENTIPKRLNWTQPETRNWMKSKKKWKSNTPIESMTTLYMFYVLI